jgi:hypothetical protein
MLKMSKKVATEAEDGSCNWPMSIFLEHVNT